MTAYPSPEGGRYSYTGPCWRSTTVNLSIMLEWINVLLSLSFLALAVAIMRLKRHSDDLSVWYWAGLTFCLVRAADRLLLFFDTADYRPAWIGFVFDIIVMAVLIFVAVGLSRVAAGIRHEKARAMTMAEEYEHSRRYFESLARHRLANPLTTILAGMQTLHDHEFDKRDRCELLVAMMAQSKALAEVSLDPTPRDTVEQRLLEETGGPGN